MKVLQSHYQRLGSCSVDDAFDSNWKQEVDSKVNECARSFTEEEEEEEEERRRRRKKSMMTKIRKSRMSDFSCEKMKVCMDS